MYVRSGRLLAMMHHNRNKTNSNPRAITHTDIKKEERSNLKDRRLLLLLLFVSYIISRQRLRRHEISPVTMWKRAFELDCWLGLNTFFLVGVKLVLYFIFLSHSF